MFEVARWRGWVSLRWKDETPESIGQGRSEQHVQVFCLDTPTSAPVTAPLAPRVCLWNSLFFSKVTSRERDSISTVPLPLRGFMQAAAHCPSFMRQRPQLCEGCEARPQKCAVCELWTLTCGCWAHSSCRCKAYMRRKYTLVGVNEQNTQSTALVLLAKVPTWLSHD